MTLRQKTLLLVAVAVGALVAGLYLCGRLIVAGSFTAAERREAIARVQSTRSIVITMAQEFGDRADDWSDWDETSRFVAGDNPDYIAANVDYNSFAAIGWDLFMVVRADGTPAVAVARDRDRGLLVPPPAGLAPYLPALMRGAAASAPPIAGLGLVDGRPMLLASRAIRNTDQSPGKAAGRLILGHVIDDAWMQRLTRFTFLDVAFVPLPDLAGAREVDRRAAAALAGGDGARAAAESDQLMAGWGLLRDLDGAPILLMRVEHDRALRAHSQQILRAGTIALTIVGALVALLVLALLGRAVLQPLARLSAGVRGLERGERTGVTIESKDELGALAAAFNQMAAVIADREASLEAARARTRLVLDSTGDALIPCSPDGVIDGEVSAAARAWFGEPALGADVAGYLAGADARMAVTIRLGLEQLAAGDLPFAAAIDQLPRRLARDGRRYALSYRPIDGAGLLVVATDITALAEAEAAEASARENHAVVANLLHDPVAFERFVEISERLLADSRGAASAVERTRALHTLKGNAAVFGMASVAAAAQALEDRLAEGGDAGDAFAALHLAWRTAVDRTAAHRRRGESQIQLAIAEHDAFVRALEQGADRGELARLARSWRLDPVAHVVGRLAGQARRIADDRGKPVDVTVDADGSRIDIRATAPFWASLVHVVRNAVDHGLEEPAARAAAGKPARGAIRIEARQTAAGALRIAIADDGAGIDWERIDALARARGVDVTRREDGLFADGVTTRDQATELSGRGVGLAAVRAACQALGVRIDVHSTRGAGSELVFTFPARRAHRMRTPSAA